MVADGSLRFLDYARNDVAPYHRTAHHNIGGLDSGGSRNDGGGRGVEKNRAVGAYPSLR
jgi:hypothetical protein